MSARRDLILLFHRDQAVAAVVRRGRVVEITTHTSEAGADLPDAVEWLLGMIYTRPGSVWVLSSDVWSQAVRVPEVIARRVPKAQLGQFLGFEVEPLSGIRASEAQTGVAELGPLESDRQYWVTQTESATFDRIADAVALHGGRLMGVAHPAGAQRRLGSPGDVRSSWSRLEVWPDLTLGIRHSAAGTVRQLLPAGSLGLSSPEVLDWLERGQSAGQLELLTGADVDSLSLAGIDAARQFDLKYDTDLEPVLQVWAAELANRPALPIVRPVKTPMSPRTLKWIGAGLAAATLAICFGHYQFLSITNASEAQELNEKISLINSRQKTSQALTKSINKLKEDVAKFAQQRDDLDHELTRYRQQLSGQQQRMPELLRALARHSDSGLLIREIESDGDRIRITGRCLDMDQANQLASRMARDLAGLNLVVELPSKIGQLLLGSGGPHDFEMIIRDRAG